MRYPFRVALLLDARVHRELLRHARAEGGRECCGLLLGATADARRVARAVPALNVALRPEREFLLAPEPLLHALRDEREGGPRVVGVYHSHPRGPTAPSPTDEREMWPRWSYVIVAPASDGALAARSFRRDAPGAPIVEELVIVGAEGVTS